MKSLPPPADRRRVFLGLHDNPAIPIDADRVAHADQKVGAENDPAYGVPEGDVRPAASHTKDTSLPESSFLHPGLLYYLIHLGFAYTAVLIFHLTKRENRFCYNTSLYCNYSTGFHLSGQASEGVRWSGCA